MQVAILGPVDVRDGGGSSVPLVGRFPRALLARLLIELGQVVAVDRLTDDLWQGRPPSSAPVALRVHVAKLRRCLELATGAPGTEVLVYRAPGYVLTLDPGVLDKTTFERDLARSLELAARGDVARAVRQADAALSLWRGTPFAEVADWEFVRLERDRLEELRLGLAEERAGWYLTLDRHVEVLPDLRLLLASHPLRERLCGLTMLALYRNSRQAEALRTYEDCRRHLADLGVVPGSALQALVEAVLLQSTELDWHAGGANGVVGRITSGRSSREGAGPSPPPERSDLRWASTRDDPPFVGREVEGSSLARARRQVVTQGERHLLLLSGEPGIGKTRLAAEAARSASRDGSLVLYGRCDEEATVSYQPFVQALQHYARRVEPDELRRMLGTAGSELAGIVPAVGAVTAGVEPNERANADAYGLFEDVDRFVTTMAQRQPVVLVLDDLHWADRPTLQLLRHVLRSPAAVPLLVIGAYRSTDLDLRSPLAAELAHLIRSPGYDLVPLDGLRERELACLLAELSGHYPDADLVTAFLRETQGNPFFVVELARHLLDLGGMEAITSLAAGEGIPEGVRHVVEQRLGRLSDAANRVLRLAAVIGPEFDLWMLAEISGLEDEALVGALDEALAAHLVVEVHDGVEAFAFPHALVRQSLYESMSRARRSRAHRRIATVLESRCEAPTGLLLAALASHLCEVVAMGSATEDEVARAIDASRRAAIEAREASAHEICARHLHCAVGACPEQRDAVLRCELLVELAQAEHRAGRDELARTALGEAADLANDLGRADLLVRTALAYSGGVAAQPVVLGGDGARVLELLERGLAVVDEADLVNRARLLARRSRWLFRDDPGGRRKASLEAVELARTSGLPKVIAAVLADHFWTIWGPDHARERLTVADEIVALGERTEDRRILLRGAQCRFHALVEVGPPAAMQAAAALRDSLAAELRDPEGRYAAAVWGAVTAANEGRFDDAEEKARAARRMRDISGPSQGSGSFAAFLTQLRFLQGRLAELLPAQEELARSSPGGASLLRTARLMMYVASGRRDDAAALLDDLVSAGLDRIERGFDWWAEMLAISGASIALGHRRAASLVYDELLPYEERNGVLGQSAFLGAVAHHLGDLAIALERWDAAVEHLERGLEQHRAMGARAYVALSEEACARALLGRDQPGDRGAAVDLATRAAATARELGMIGLEPQAVAILARAGVASVPSYPRGTPPPC